MMTTNEWASQEIERWKNDAQALSRENHKLVAAIEEQRAEIKHLKSHVTLHMQKARDEYWAWQGDGTDDLNTLTCPVLIQASVLREMRAKADLCDKLAKLIAEAEVV